MYRVAREECGLRVEIVESLGAFEHIYETADVPDVDGKHYLANGYVVDANGGEFTCDDQHTTIQRFTSAPDLLHEFMAAYLDAAESLFGWL